MIDVEVVRTRWRAAGRPSLAAALTVLAVCLPAHQDLNQPVNVSPGDMASLGLVGVAAWLVLARRAVAPRATAALLALLPVACGLATLLSVDVHSSVVGLVRTVQIWVLIPLAVALVVRDRYDRALVYSAVMAAGLAESVLGIYQFFTHTGASIGGQRIRAVGTFGATDVMAMATVVGFGLVTTLALVLTTRGRLRGALLLAAGVEAFAIVLSQSRGAWIAVTCAVAVMLFAAGPRVALGALVFGTAGVVVLTAGLGVGSTVLASRLETITASASQPDQSVIDRYSLWQAAEGIWRNHPATGIGPRNFPEFRDSYAPLELSAASDTDDPVHGFRRQPLLSPHNQYLLMLAETGLAGFAAFAGLLLGLLAGSFRAVRTAGRRTPFFVAAGFLTWLIVDFCYADLGGATSVALAVMLGLVVSWAGTGRGAGDPC